MTATAALSLQAAVAHAIANATSGRWVQASPWRRSLKDADNELRCAFCLADLTSPGTLVYNSLLVAPVFGGPAFGHNSLRCCDHCAKTRRNRDVVGWPRFKHLGTPDSRARVLQLREEVLTISANHLTPTRAGAPRDKVMSALRSRWAHPRIKVFAFHGVEGCFIGWTPRCGFKAALGELAGILRFGFKASAISERRLTLFQVPADQFLDAVWALIEHGALVEQLKLDEHEAVPFDDQDWRHWWPMTFDAVSDLQRRRPRLSGNNSRTPGTAAHAAMQMRAIARLAGLEAPDVSATRSLRSAPRPPRLLSQSSSARAHRKTYRKAAMERKRRAWLKAQADLDRYKERVRQGKALPASFEEQWAMELHVMDLFEAINRWP